MKLIGAAAFASLAAAAPAAAADLFGSAPPMTFPASQAATAVEIGTNWYVRGDLGVGFSNAPTLSVVTLPTLPTAWLGSNSSTGPDAGFVGGAGFGYRFNSFLRFDATWDYWTAPNRNRSIAAICPYGLTPVPNPSVASPLGFLYDPTNTCAGSTNLNQHNNTVLANAYVDLGTYGGFTPYVGGGLGVNASSLQGSANFVETANGAPYVANLSNLYGYPSVWVNSAGHALVPQPAIAFAQQNWNRSINSTTYHFAWALTAGVSFQLTPSASLDVGYRYLNAGQSSLLLTPATGLTVRQNNVSQQILVGIRYVLQ